MSLDQNRQNEPAENFRTIEDMTKPDWRQAYIVLIDHRFGTTSPKTLTYQHRIVAQYPLDVSVPEDVRIQWDTARNLWLYAWHVWRFYAVAELHAYATLEMALRIKLDHDREEHPPGLKKLMSEALSLHLLRDEQIEHHQRLQARAAERRGFEEKMARDLGLPLRPPGPDHDPQAYCRLLAETVPMLRNHHAHGSSSIRSDVDLTFSLCRDLINQLHKNTSGAIV